MSRLQFWLLTGSTLAVGGTGVALHVMKDWMVSDDPFAVINHPWQPLMLKAHLVSAPFLVFAVGLIFSGHILEKIKANRRAGRRSGLVLLALFTPMVVSGVLIQVVSVQFWLRAMVWTHLGAGLIYLALFAAHLLLTPSASKAGTQQRRLNGAVRPGRQFSS